MTNWNPQANELFLKALELRSAAERQKFLDDACAGDKGQVLRFQGPNGQSPGGYVEAYITGGQGELNRPIGLARDAAGNLYVSDMNTTANVTRFAPSAQAAFTVTLDSASASQVSVNYATANGTATAGTDYTQTSGTLVFAPGVTSQTVNVPVTTVATGGPTRTFTMNLSGASGATINRGQATGSILNRQTKFFVVDSGTVKTYEYGSGGTSEEITVPQGSTNTAPRGAATTAAGDKVWVVDANKNVYVYDNHGVPLGSWLAGGLSSSTTLTGIATNGTDIWLVDSSTDKVYKYTGAASRLSGSQNAASNFALLVHGKNGNTNPQDIVTDGTSLWVVDGSQLKVFKYTLAGSSLGSWAIDPANAHPTGITINPNNVSDIWIVDNSTLKVYQYTAAAGRTSGSQNAAATFTLNPYNTNPQGIADPPPPGMLLTPAAVPLALTMPLPEGATAVAPIPSLPDRDAIGAGWGEETLRPAAESFPSIPTGWFSAVPAGDPSLTGGRVSTRSSELGNGNPSAPRTPLAPVVSDGARCDPSVADLFDAWSTEVCQASAVATDTLFALLADDPASAE